MPHLFLFPVYFLGLFHHHPLSRTPTDIMEWYVDGVTNAITTCRKEKALFIVYVKGTCTTIAAVYMYVYMYNNSTGPVLVYTYALHKFTW